MRINRFFIGLTLSFLAATDVLAGTPAKGSFELSKTMPDIVMVNVEVGTRCARNGDIGMDSSGLILSCQSDGNLFKWKSSPSSAQDLRLTGCWTYGNCTPKCPVGYSNKISTGVASGPDAHYISGTHVRFSLCEK